MMNKPAYFETGDGQAINNGTWVCSSCGTRGAINKDNFDILRNNNQGITIGVGFEMPPLTELRRYTYVCVQSKNGPIHLVMDDK